MNEYDNPGYGMATILNNAVRSNGQEGVSPRKKNLIANSVSEEKQMKGNNGNGCWVVPFIVYKCCSILHNY